MSRVKLLRIKPEKFFKKIQRKTKLTFQELADICKVHRRSFSDWKYGRYLMPKSVFKKLVKMTGIESPNIKILSDYWYTKEGGKMGGKIVFKKYGKIPGWTRGASRKGALKAIKTHRKKKTGLFYCSKPIFIPKKSSQLAELIGIILGDGCITPSQLTITLHRSDDKEFVLYVSNLFQKLFKIKPSTKDIKKDNIINTIVSRSRLIEFLVDKGLKVGGKVRQQVGVPSWIERSRAYTKACLRGLFDTDGCFYVDKHRYKDKIYHNCGMNFTNRSLPLLFFFKTKLEQLGFRPTNNTKFSISLRRENEIIKYFQIVDSSNPKHLRKFEKYFKNKFGGVPKSGHTGTVSKTDGR